MELLGIAEEVGSVVADGSADGSLEVLVSAEVAVGTVLLASLDELPPAELLACAVGCVPAVLLGVEVILAVVAAPVALALGVPPEVALELPPVDWVLEAALVADNEETGAGVSEFPSSELQATSSAVQATADKEVVNRIVKYLRSWAYDVGSFERAIRTRSQLSRFDHRDSLCRWCRTPGHPLSVRSSPLS